MPITIDGTNGISGIDGSAATPSIQGSDTNTGVFYPAADTVAISTGGTERLRVDSTGNLRFNSGYGSVATAYGCRAWVNFNGTGTVAIRASGNVTSITDNGTGDYTINFTAAMPDTNYNAVFGAGSQTVATGAYVTEQNDSVIRSTTQLRIYSTSNSVVLADRAVISASIFR